MVSKMSEEGVPLRETPSSPAGGLAAFMCCSTESQDKDQAGNAPAELFGCFNNKKDEGDSPGEAPEEEGGTEGGMDDGAGDLLGSGWDG